MRKFWLALAIFFSGFILAWFIKPEPDLPVVDKDLPVSATLPELLDPPMSSEADSRQGASTPSRHVAQNGDPKQGLEQFKQLLERKQYKQAVDLFQIVERENERASESYKSELLKHLNAQLNQANFESFSELAQYWLSAYYSDIDVLLLLARYNSGQNFFGEAVNLYQIIYSYAHTDSDFAKIDKSFKEFIRGRDSRLLEQQDWSELQNFYELIERAGIAKALNRFRLAEIYVQNGYREDARYILEELISSGLLINKATKLLAGLNEDKPVNRPIVDLAQQVLPLKRFGNHYVASLSLRNNVELNLLLDTGASITSISESAFHNKVSSLGYDFAAPRLFHTANGVVRGDVMQVSSLFFAGFELKNLEVAIVPMGENEHVDGLLGMNVLSQFRFHINQEKSVLVLDKK